jgi:hypothetical protein
MKIWSTKHWPKISTFLWLVAHRSILTWDNLMKWGFIGPSICPLFLGEAESQNHLLNLCFYSSQVWDQCAIVMRISDRKCEGLRETIEEWRDTTFQSPILNRIWKLLPGFILWKLWKERNRCIFLTTHRDWKIIWTQIHSNIRETISLQSWKEMDLKCPTHEQSILDSWNVTPNPFLTKNPQRSQTKGNPSLWSPPPAGFIKLNFDGASKGNPGATGFGVVFRNRQGNILLISMGSLGHTTNNATELWGLTKGLQIAHAQGYHQLIVEGDSQVILNLFGKILNGADPDKISPCWHLSLGLSTIATLIRPHLALIPSHIKGKI